MSGLKDKQKSIFYGKAKKLLCGTKKLKDSLKNIENKWIRGIDFWFERVKEGYIIQFDVEYNESFDFVNENFETKPRKILIIEIPTWIKMVFVQNGIVHMEPDMMKG